MKKNFTFFLIIYLSLFFSCTHPTNSPSEQENIDDNPYAEIDNDNIHELNNSIDSLLLKYGKYFKRTSGNTGKGIIDSFYGSMSDGDYGICNYSYIFNKDGTYEISYIHEKNVEQEKITLASDKETGNFILYKKDNFHFIKLTSSSNGVKNYRFLVSDNYLVLLKTDKNGNYVIESDLIIYKCNAKNSAIEKTDSFIRDDGSEGIIGKWILNIGEVFSYVSVGLVKYGNSYSNEPITYKAYPVTYEIIFSEDGFFSCKKTSTFMAKQSNGKHYITNTIEGVFGVIETTEENYTIGFVTTNDIKYVSSYKVSQNYLYFEKSIDNLFAKYSVSYISDYGIIPEKNYIEENSVLKKEHLPELNCNGFKFLGWYIDDNKIIEDNFTVTKDITLTAKWLQVGYLINFITNNETNISPKILSFLYLEDFPEMTRDDYEFDGWYLDSNFTGTPIQFPYEINKPLFLYAKWLPNYNISFETNSDTTLPALRTSKINTMPEITQNDYVLAGWFFDSNLNNKVIFPLILTSDTIIYASWKNKAEAVVITSDNILQLDTLAFNKSFTVFYRGFFSINDFTIIRNWLNQFDFPVFLDLSFTQGIISVSCSASGYYNIRYDDCKSFSISKLYLDNITLTY